MYSADFLCYIYHKKGYWAPEYLKKDQIKSKHIKSGNSANLAINYLQFSRDYEIKKIVIVSTSTISKSIILLDCAVTSYMFFDQNLFISYHNLTNGKYITISSKWYILASDISSIKIIVIFLHGSFILIFNNILFIFLLDTNLISLSTLYYDLKSLGSDNRTTLILEKHKRTW